MSSESCSATKIWSPLEFRIRQLSRSPPGVNIDVLAKSVHFTLTFYHVVFSNRSELFHYVQYLLMCSSLTM